MSSAPKNAKNPFFSRFWIRGAPDGPRNIFSEREILWHFFSDTCSGPHPGPLGSTAQKNSVFLTFLVEQGITSNLYSGEWGPGRGPEILRSASMTSQLSLEKKIKCISALDQILDVLQRTKPKTAMFWWFWIKMRPQNSKCPSTFLEKMHRALSKTI